jgi:hypothetical protein
MASTAIVVPDEGVQQMLNILFIATAVKATLTLKLFANNYTPIQSSTLSSFTEATGGGYSAITLTRGTNWVYSAGTPPVVVYLVGSPSTFTFTGALTTNLTVYGYYVTDGTYCWWAQLLNAAFTPANNGDNIVITPALQMSSGTPSG